MLDEDILEEEMGFSIKTLNRNFKHKHGFTIIKYHKNYVANNIVKMAYLERKSIKRYFEEIIDKNINTYWSDYKAFNTFINNKK